MTELSRKKRKPVRQERWVFLFLQDRDGKGCARKGVRSLRMRWSADREVQKPFASVNCQHEAERNKEWLQELFGVQLSR